MRLAARAPGKVNLSLLVGTPRGDGLHPLVSVVQAVSLADELTLSHAAGDADEVVCPGIDGPNVASGQPLWTYDNTHEIGKFLDENGLSKKATRARFSTYGAYYVSNVEFLK